MLAYDIVSTRDSGRTRGSLATQWTATFRILTTTDSAVRFVHTFSCLSALAHIQKLRRSAADASSHMPDDVGSTAQEGSKPSNPDGKKGGAFSHALNDSFGTQELMDELGDRQSFGKRGELVLVAQVVCLVLVLLPPMRLQGVVYLIGARFV